MTPNTLSRDGADHLAHKIERYWRQHGVVVTVQTFEDPALVNRGKDPSREARLGSWVVRSDLVGGLPRK